MHEFHGWIALSDSAYEMDMRVVESVVDHLREIVDDSQFDSSRFVIENLNGRYFLIATGHVQRRRQQADVLEVLLSLIARRLPGSYGVVYERDDEWEEPPGGNAFKVRVLARGHLEERGDPFLSPCVPAIEDPEPPDPYPDL